ncbi:hypothetical protein ACVW1A_005274 [Bradyrhizobium sp. LB1.3]
MLRRSPPARRRPPTDQRQRRRLAQRDYRRRKHEKGMLIEFEISRFVIKKLIATGWLFDHERDDKALVSETVRALVEDLRPPEK